MIWLSENIYGWSKWRSTDEELVTQHQLDKQRNQLDLASADYDIARDSHASASAAAELTVQAAEANISVAELTVEQSTKNYETLIVNQEIEVAREALKRSILTAPNASPTALRKLLVEGSDGDSASTNESEEPTGDSRYTVLKVLLQPGGAVTQLPIMRLGDLRQMVCIAEVYEADVKELRVDQTVTIRSPAFSGRFADGEFDPNTNRRSGGIRGRVVRIGRLVSPPGLSNRNPLAPADRSVVGVRVAIDDDKNGASGPGTQTAETASEHASKHVELEVTVEFDRVEPATATETNAPAVQDNLPAEPKSTQP